MKVWWDLVTDDEKAALADVYEKAAEYLEENGWYPGDLGKLSAIACFANAITWSSGQNAVVKACYLASEVLELEDPGVVAIFRWNDDPTRTKDEVINVLHGLANKLR